MDEQGAGVASGEPFAPGLRSLLDHAVRPDWVAEDPEAHLLPHLQRWSSESLKVTGARVTEGAAFEVDLEWSGDPRRHDELRRAVFALVGSVAEGATAVVQTTTEQPIVFEVTTGMLDDQTAFKSHGHLLRLVVR